MKDKRVIDTWQWAQAAQLKWQKLYRDFFVEFSKQATVGNGVGRKFSGGGKRKKYQKLSKNTEK